MSVDHDRFFKTPVHILGSGCAALSLAARAGELPRHAINVSDDDGPAPINDHIWGFWAHQRMDYPAALARHRWHSWQIVTPASSDHGGNLGNQAPQIVTMHSAAHPYMAVQRTHWLDHCRMRAIQAGVTFGNDAPAHAQILDSRSPPMPKNAMIQHFIGWEIAADAPCFDPSTAILMDFRCDQTRGMHFIYVLPFSSTEALIESTMFSPDVQEDGFYEGAIADYLAAHCDCQSYRVQRREKGAIPLAELSPRDDSLMPIGANGGAIRPSSGYAFAFIQKQIIAAISTAHAAGEGKGRVDSGGESDNQLSFANPHRKIDLLMDRIFLAVLRRWPDIAPSLFSRLAKALSGDEFAAFMSGDAGWGLRAKIILAMPKWPFVRVMMPALMPGLFGNPASPARGESA